MEWIITLVSTSVGAILGFFASWYITKKALDKQFKHASKEQNKDRNRIAVKVLLALYEEFEYNYYHNQSLQQFLKGHFTTPNEIKYDTTIWQQFRSEIMVMYDDEFTGNVIKFYRAVYRLNGEKPTTIKELIDTQEQIKTIMDKIMVLLNGTKELTP